MMEETNMQDEKKDLMVCDTKRKNTACFIVFKYCIPLLSCHAICLFYSVLLKLDVHIQVAKFSFSSLAVFLSEMVNKLACKT